MGKEMVEKESIPGCRPFTQPALASPPCGRAGWDPRDAAGTHRDGLLQGRQGLHHMAWEDSGGDAHGHLLC